MHFNKNIVLTLFASCIIVISADLIAGSFNKGKILFTEQNFPQATHFMQQEMNWGKLYPHAGTIIGLIFTIIASYFLCKHLSIIKNECEEHEQTQNETFQFDW